MKKGLFFFAAMQVFGIFLMGTDLEAQSLTSRIENLRGLQREALQAEELGDYDRAIELAREIQLATDVVNRTMDALRRWYVLKNRLELARQVMADRFAPEEYGMAVGYSDEGYALIGDTNFLEAEVAVEEGIYYADLAIELSKDLYAQMQNESKEVTKTGSRIEVVKDGSTYEVRLIPERRDSLWRIAEYSFVYNDPWKWTLLYEANKDRIKNPNLIYPGQQLRIPPLKDSDVPSIEVNKKVILKEIEGDVAEEESDLEETAEGEESLTNESTVTDDLEEFESK